jgi:hypothetical protein
MLLASWKQPYILMMLGWFRNIWIFTSRVNWSVISSYRSRLFSITFKAHTKFEYRSRTKYTRPYFPFPNYLIFTKSSTLTLRGFLGGMGMSLSPGSCIRLLLSKVGSTIRLRFMSPLLTLLRKEGACRGSSLRS